MADICPKSGKCCIDDLCRGSGTCLITGDYMMESCPKCRAPISPEYNIGCNCPPDEQEYYEDDPFGDEQD